MDKKALLTLSRPIVIEGPDGSGKSTLIENYFPDAIHMGGPPKCRTELRERLYLPERGKVYDRWTAISEQVYGHVLRDKPMVSQSEFYNAIRNIQPVVIYCCTFDSIMDENLEKQRVKPHKSPEFIEQIITHRSAIRRTYYHVMSELPKLGCIVLPYNYLTSGGMLQDEDGN